MNQYILLIVNDLWGGGDSRSVTAGLAEDIRRYGEWMREEAQSRIGHFYPRVHVAKEIADKRDDLQPYVGKGLTVIAWLWARTVASPDPLMRGAHVPLVKSFVLSSKKGKRAIVIPRVDRASRSYRFSIKTQGITSQEYACAKQGTKAGRGSNFVCVVSKSPIPGDYIKAQGMEGRLGARLMAIVAEGWRTRLYLDPVHEMEKVARSATAKWKPIGSVPERLTGGTCYGYGLTAWSSFFTDRQLLALTTFSDLVAEARERVLEDALAAGMDTDMTRLVDEGTGAHAYADAVATYLGLAIGKAAAYWSSNCTWHTSGEKINPVFGRHALPMIWDYAETNALSQSTGNWSACVNWVRKVVAASPAAGGPAAIQQHSAADTPLLSRAVVATDPPYYDNIAYADLSDFFFVWHRSTLKGVWPDLFRRVLVPKEQELVAVPYRHGGREAAERFFMKGMSQALRHMRRSGNESFPVTIYYAFKQAEVAKEGLTSPGWATFLQALCDAGYMVLRTWPARTEMPNRPIAMGTNALASSIVLVCRKRPESVKAITRREFVARLRSELPDALEKIRESGAGPVDIPQAAIGPGMEVFTAASKVLEPDDSAMSVRTAIAIINQVRDEISGEEATGYDRETRFCIEWFEQFGMEEGASGDAISLAQAHDIGLGDLRSAGVVQTSGGRMRLVRRDELPADWGPGTDKRLTGWECAQHLVRILGSPQGGIDAAARLYQAMGGERGGAARMLAYRLYDICERRGWAEEALVWNTLAQEWPALDAALIRMEEDALRSPEAVQEELGHGRPEWKG